MAAWDKLYGPWPDQVVCAVDAMGKLIRDVIFVETECGLVVQYRRGEDGDILLDEDGFVLTLSSTRPAPITLIPAGRLRVAHTPA